MSFPPHPMSSLHVLKLSEHGVHLVPIRTKPFLQSAQPFPFVIGRSQLGKHVVRDARRAAQIAPVHARQARRRLKARRTRLVTLRIEEEAVDTPCRDALCVDCLDQRRLIDARAVETTKPLANRPRRAAAHRAVLVAPRTARPVKELVAATQAHAALQRTNAPSSPTTPPANALHVEMSHAVHRSPWSTSHLHALYPLSSNARLSGGPTAGDAPIAVELAARLHEPSPRAGCFLHFVEP